jgi:uncharacterized surface protein with fasciclin (FAS1) repeats
MRAPTSLIVVLLIGLTGCGRAPTQAEIEKKAAELIAEGHRKEELAAQEAIKIAEERERLASIQQEQREKVAADILSRTEQRETQRAGNAERAAAEQARREAVTGEIKTFLDNLWTESSQLNDNVIVKFNGQTAKEGMELVSPAGYSVKYLKRDGDYLVFVHDEDAFNLTLRKSVGGLAFAQVTHKQPIAPGFAVGQLLGNFSLGDAPAVNAGLTIMKATYGADQEQRDVKDLVKGKLTNGGLSFRANSSEFGGDPAFGKMKTFYIKYLYQGRLMEKSFQEGSQVSIP